MIHYELILDFDKETHPKNPLIIESKKKYLFSTAFLKQILKTWGSKFEIQSQFEWLSQSNIFAAQLSSFQQWWERALQLTPK